MTERRRNVQALADRHGLAPGAPLMLAQEGTDGRCYAAVDLFHALLADVERLRSAPPPARAASGPGPWVDTSNVIHRWMSAEHHTDGETP